MAFSLENVLKASTAVPPILVIYGVEGIGKTGIGACAPAPIFIQTENGLNGVMPNGKPTLDYIAEVGGGAFPLATTYEEVISALTVLCSDPHDYKTVVLDSADWLESIIHTKVAADHSQPSVQSIDYGKGFGEANEHWKVDILPALDLLRTKRGMTVIVLAHHMDMEVKDPSTEPYRKYMPNLHKGLNPIVKQWADAVLFANYRIATTQTDGGFNKKNTRAIGSGERLLHCQEMPYHDAKNRFGMPTEIPMSWDAIANCIPYFNQGVK